MGELQLGPVNSLISIPNVSYGFTQTEVLDRQDIRTKSGGLFTFIETGTFHQFKLPMSWVNSLDRSLVNSWWKTATDLTFLLDSDFPSSLFTVRIMKKEEPFQTFVQPYFQTFYEGELVLETI